MIIKYATTEDIAAIAAVEAECFPPAEAATEKEFIDRVKSIISGLCMRLKS